MLLVTKKGKLTNLNFYRTKSFDNKISINSYSYYSYKKELYILKKFTGWLIEEKNLLVVKNPLREGDIDEGFIVINYIDWTI